MSGTCTVQKMDAEKTSFFVLLLLSLTSPTHLMRCIRNKANQDLTASLDRFLRVASRHMEWRPNKEPHTAAKTLILLVNTEKREDSVAQRTLQTDLILCLYSPNQSWHLRVLKSDRPSDSDLKSTSTGNCCSLLRENLSALWILFTK